MKINFGGTNYGFRPWRPADGACLRGAIGLDTETTRIDEARPWLSPTYVLGAAFDGEAGFFVTREHLKVFLAAHPTNPLVFHNAPFDLDVIHTAVPAARIYDRVETNPVWDTQLLHRLLTLGEHGHTSQGQGESTLERCAESYLSIELDKEAMDSKGNLVRLSYGKWLKQRPNEIEPCYLQYLAEDVIAAHKVFLVLRSRVDQILWSASGTWGYVSDDWLRGCVARFGPQTHHIQLKAAIVLRAITANGLCLDTRRRQKLTTRLEELLTRQKCSLRESYYLPGQRGSNKALQAILQRIAKASPHLVFPKTETGNFATRQDVLQGLADSVPFVKLLLEYKETEKLLGSFVGKMAKSELHPSFNTLARSGRTSSFGDVNAQNLPKRDEVRSCFVPRPGHVFIDADYAMIELVTLAQACRSQFGLDSKMADAINAGEDLHRLVAAKMLGKAPTEVTKAERQKAKPVNFGKPGGMGDETLTSYAEANYGVALTAGEASALSQSWLDLFPEMRDFLGDTTDTPLELAVLLNLTRATYAAHTGDQRFSRRPITTGREDHPFDVLGMMLLKVVKVNAPQTRDGRSYSQDEIDYFFASLEAVLDRLPHKLHQAVRDRAPSKQLQRAVMGLVGRAGVFTATGRLRADASFTARHNTIFQGLAADGAKLALWKLWRAGYRVVNFIHDQVLVEVPEGSDLRRHAVRIKKLMISGMREVVADVRIDVAYAASGRWYKDAEEVYDATGEKLLVWKPSDEVDRATN